MPHDKLSLKAEIFTFKVYKFQFIVTCELQRDLWVYFIVLSCASD